MSEEKMYELKNDKGEYWDFENTGFWRQEILGCYATPSKKKAELVVDGYGGHIVTLIEEPEKVKLPKKAAEGIDRVKDGGYDITYIFTEYAMPNEVSDWLEDSDDDAEHREERGLMLINAYLYGYTVAKEKKYLVYKTLGGKHTADVQYAQAYLTSVHSKIIWILTSWILTNDGTDESFFQFTEAEIEHYGLQDCERVEVTDDAEES